MDLSRRRVLQSMLVGAVALGSPLRWAVPALAAPGGKTAVAASWLHRSSYVPLVGSAFTVAAGGTTVARLTLSAIRDLSGQQVKTAANDGRFSLLFTSTSVLAQGTCAFHQDALGDGSLFVVPVGPAASTRSYEVIVNRLA